MESVRIYEMPDCRMVKSGSGLFGESALERFEAWMDRQPKGMFPRDYLSFEGICLVLSVQGRYGRAGGI